MDSSPEVPDLLSIIGRASSALAVFDSELLEQLAGNCETLADDAGLMRDGGGRNLEHAGAEELQVLGRLLGNTGDMLTIFQLVELSRPGRTEYHTGFRYGA